MAEHLGKRTPSVLREEICDFIHNLHSNIISRTRPHPKPPVPALVIEQIAPLPTTDCNRNKHQST